MKMMMAMLRSKTREIGHNWMHQVWREEMMLRMMKMLEAQDDHDDDERMCIRTDRHTHRQVSRETR